MERDGNNGLIRRYVNGAHRISMTAGTKVYYFHYDPLGSVVNLTSSTGATEWTDSYEPFGLTHSETMNDTHGAPTQVLKFAGEYLDPTGLYHLRARQYDPSTGRFTTLDPLPNPTTDPYMSAYSYANDRPIVLTDPSGLRAGTCGSIGCWFTQDRTAGCLTAIAEGIGLSALSAGALTPVAATDAAIGCGVSLGLDYVGEQLGSHTKTAGEISFTGRDVANALARRSDRRFRERAAASLGSRTVRFVLILVRR